METRLLESLGGGHQQAWNSFLQEKGLKKRNIRADPMSEIDPVRTLIREIALAIGMITILVLAMWAHTGSMPPLVVVESNSMQHDSSGEIEQLDAGDLVLVHSPSSSNVITFAETTNPSSRHYGYKSLGMEGDVIIYERNGESLKHPNYPQSLIQSRDRL